MTSLKARVVFLLSLMGLAIVCGSAHSEGRLLDTSARQNGTITNGRNAHGPKVPSAVVTSYGRYRGRTLGSVDIQGTSGGIGLLSADHEHIETTRTIPCRLGETWGFTFELHDLPEAVAYHYRSEMRHPPIEQPDGIVLTNSVIRMLIEPGQTPPSGEMWSFLEGYEYELVPGKWTRTIFINDRHAASVSFRVARDVPMRAILLGIRHSSAKDTEGGPVKGAVVTQVYRNTPASEAGIQEWDIIARLNDEPVLSHHDLHQTIPSHAGETISLGIQRGRRFITIEVQLLSK